MGFPGGSVVKKLPTNAGDEGLIPGLRRSTGEGNGNPLQYSCLGSPVDRGAWRATVHGVPKSWTQQLKESEGSACPKHRVPHTVFHSEFPLEYTAGQQLWWVVTSSL